jgi:hypothetical protein
MTPSLERRLRCVARARITQRRTHLIFRDPHETQDVAQARVRARIASGQASPGDRFVTFFWRAPQREE